MKFLFDRCFSADAPRWVWNNTEVSGHSPEDNELAQETNEDPGGQEELEQTLLVTTEEYDAASTEFSDEDLPEGTDEVSEGLEGRESTPDVVVPLTSGLLGEFVQELKATDALTPEVRGKIRNLMNEYQGMAAMVDTTREQEAQFSERARAIMAEIQNMLPAGFVAKNNHTLTADYRSDLNDENVAKNWGQRADIRITRVQKITTTETGDRKNAEVDVVNREDIKVPDDIAEDFQKLSNDPKEYASAPEEEARLIKNAFGRVRQAFVSKPEDFARAVRLYVDDHPEAAVLSNDEINLLYTNVMGNHDGEQPFKDLQAVMAKLDPRLLGTMNENGGVDNKLGYASLTACLQIDAGLAGYKNELEKIDYLKGMTLVDGYERKEAERDYLTPVTELIQEFNRGYSWGNVSPEEFLGKIEMLDSAQDTINQMMVAMYDQELVQMGNGERMTLRSLLQQDPAVLNQAMQGQVTSWGESPLVRELSVKIHTLHRFEKIKSDIQNLWVEAQEPEIYTPEQTHDAMRSGNDVPKYMLNIPGKGRLGALEYTAEAGLSRGNFATVNKCLAYIVSSPDASMEKFQQLAENSAQVLEAKMSEAWEKYETYEKTGRTDLMKSNLADFKKLVGQGEQLCDTVNGTTASPLLTQFQAKIDNRRNALQTDEQLLASR